MMEANERRERFLLAALEVSGDPVEALDHARAMEGFVLNGLEGQRLLAPPREPDEPADLREALAWTDPDRPEVPAEAEDTAPPDPPRKTRHGRTWTPEKVAEFKRAWAADADISEIAAQFNLTKPSAYQRARALGLGRRRPLGKWGRGRTANSVEAAAPPAKATPPRPPLPDTSDLPAAARPNGPEYTSIEGVIHFLGTRDVQVAKDPNSIKTPRWLVEGRRDMALNADELLSYANKERRRIGKPALVYGL